VADGEGRDQGLIGVVGGRDDRRPERFPGERFLVSEPCTTIIVGFVSGSSWVHINLSLKKIKCQNLLINIRIYIWTFYVLVHNLLEKEIFFMSHAKKTNFDALA
jgi:hypothetical protein